MAPINLTEAEQQQLEKLTHNSHNKKIKKRASALLALNRGEKAHLIANRIGVSRSTVYEWINRYRQDNGATIEARLQDQPRPGRPRVKRKKVIQLLPAVLDTKPQTHGYSSRNWTSSLLQRHLETQHGVEVSRETIRRALEQL